MIGDEAQYQELVKLYEGYGDEELVALGRGIADLTDTAQEALKSELQRRGLKVAQDGESIAKEVLTDDDLADMRAYAAIAPAECIFDFADERLATAAYYALTGDGIEAVVASAPDSRGSRVVVTPKDAERAAAILSEPSAEDLKAEVEEKTEEFDLPRCPACDSDEVLLESVDPVNQWRCDTCGHSWLEESVSSPE